MSGTQINPGDKVQINTGEWYTVEMVYDNMVYVYGFQNVIHAANIIRIARKETK